MCFGYLSGVKTKITWHDDVIKWKHFPRHWPFVREIHRSPVNFPHKGQWHGALMFSLICVWINGWVNNREAGDLRCYRAHCDVTVMILDSFSIYLVNALVGILVFYIKPTESYVKIFPKFCLDEDQIVMVYPFPCRRYLYNTKWVEYCFKTPPVYTSPKSYIKQFRVVAELKHYQDVFHVLYFKVIYEQIETISQSSAI